MLDERTVHARTLFAGIAGRYQWPAEVLSAGQYGRWRRAMVRHLDPDPGARVLDVATGTGLIARDLRRRRCAVVGLDQSVEMLAAGSGMRVAADARALPFRDAGFDALTFSYLLRYVDDVDATLREIARVVRPGGRIGSVEFGLPGHPLARAAWRAYTRTVFRWATAMLGRGWRAVGAFLGPSILAWAGAWPAERQRAAWERAGIDVEVVRPMSLGGGLVIVGRKR